LTFQNPEPAINISQGLLDKMAALEIKTLKEASLNANRLSRKLTAEEIDELSAAFAEAGIGMTFIPVLPEPPPEETAVPETLFDILQANAMALSALTYAVQSLQDVALSLRSQPPRPEEILKGGQS
jgi:hypothetical protein